MGEAQRRETSGHGADRPAAWTTETLALAQELANGLPLVGAAEAGAFRIEARLGRDSLWLIVRKADGGALALRTAHAPGGGLTAQPSDPKGGALAAFKASAAAADFEVRLVHQADRLLR